MEGMEDINEDRIYTSVFHGLLKLDLLLLSVVLRWLWLVDRKLKIQYLANQLPIWLKEKEGQCFACFHPSVSRIVPSSLWKLSWRRLTEPSRTSWTWLLHPSRTSSGTTAVYRRCCRASLGHDDQPTVQPSVSWTSQSNVCGMGTFSWGIVKG